MKEDMIKRKTNWTAMVVLILGLSAIAFPLYMTIIIAFKQPAEMTNSVSGILSLPKTWSLDNFREAMRVTDFWNSLKNSVLITLLTVVLSVTIHSVMGYALGRNKSHSKFYSFVYLFIVSGMFVPFAILMMPLAKQTAELGLANWFGVIILYVVFRLSCQYPDGARGGGEGGRGFHMENILENHFPDYASDARDCSGSDCSVSVE